MHLHFERNSNAKCDCAILSLTWMGKVPDELPEDEGWKLNRTNYYQEGWLATGNVRGIVGVTFTTSHCKKTMEYPVRTNYNLRGHRSEVILVKWNEPYQKLASCDSSGIIFVWIKYEGRWSIELINDRNTPVTHFAWSHDGRMALICYQDGFVLVGSVAGQRYWSSMLNLDSTITCGIWTPDDLQVYFGTSHGGLVVMDAHGAMVAQVSLAQAPVTSMAWSCEKFKMEEGDENENPDNSNLVLAVCLSTGHIFLMKSYDDVTPIQFNTGLGGPLCMEWSNSRQLLAVAGVANHTDNNDYVNMLKCYTDTGELLYSTYIPYSQSPVTALTWGHNDKRLFVATGGVIHIAWVSRRVASLQLLSRLKVASALPLGESSVQSLPLPPRIKHLISNLFAQTIRCCVPQSRGLREFVSRAPVNGTRLHCTMIRHDEEHISSGACYTLYLEYLGGLVPLLKGKRTSKIRPEFVIFDPQVDGDHPEITYSKIPANGSDTSDTEKEDGCGGSPRAQRRRRRRRKSPTDHDDDLTYIDTLPEDARLVEVTSNIWGTKFKIHGLADCVPSNLGQVTYKTSLLHLQPRQMSLVMTELSNDIPHSPDPNFNPKVFSEDEEDDQSSISERNYSLHPPGGSGAGGGGGAVPIAPMTPKRDGNRTRTINLAHGYGSYFVRLQQLIPTEPSNQRGRIEIRKAVLENSILLRNPQLLCTFRDSNGRDPRSSAEQSEDENNLSDAGSSNNSNCVITRAQINAQLEKRNVQMENETEVPYTSPNNQPSVNSIDKNTNNTYQGVVDKVGKKVDEVSDLQSPSGKPESIEDENSYVDFNLADVISFCENFKLNDSELKLQTPVKVRQERNETSFLNHQISPPIKRNQTQNPPSPKNTVPPFALTIQNSAFESVATSSRSDYRQNINRNESFATSSRSDYRQNINRNESVATSSRSDYRQNINRYESFATSSRSDYRQNINRNVTNNAFERRDPADNIIIENIQYIDEDEENQTDTMNRSASVGYLDDIVTDCVAPCDSPIRLPRREYPKRLFLVGGPPKKDHNSDELPKSKSNLTVCGKSRSLDSNDLLSVNKVGESSNPVSINPVQPPKVEKVDAVEGTSYEPKPEVFSTKNSTANVRNLKRNELKEEKIVRENIGGSNLCIAENSIEPLPPPSPRLPRSQPVTPALSKKKRNQSASPIRKHLLNSPLLRRKRAKSKAESSDDEVNFSGDEAFTSSSHFKDLESFQKAQLRQKLKRGKVSDGNATPKVRELVMHNKAPMWNENSQVYQLDFGGRVTQESAKNFQIEFKGKQVMQFGRIDGNAYTLDFQYPFSVLQAFAVALANVTQRLK